MRGSLYCTTCRVRLSAPLELVSGKAPGVMAPMAEDRQPLVPRGSAFKSWKAVPWLHREPGDPLSFVPQYWLHPEDLTGPVRLSDDATGCCGVGGFHGPNQICQCKTAIGTLLEDCMTPTVFIPEPKATEWANGDNEYLEYA